MRVDGLPSGVEGFEARGLSFCERLARKGKSRIADGFGKEEVRPRHLVIDEKVARRSGFEAMRGASVLFALGQCRAFKNSGGNEHVGHDFGRIGGHAGFSCRFIRADAGVFCNDFEKPGAKCGRGGLKDQRRKGKALRAFKGLKVVRTVSAKHGN